MASKRIITYRIYDFLKYRGWIKDSNSSSKYIQMLPPKVLNLPKNFSIRIGKISTAIDYCEHINRILNILFQLHSDVNSLKTLNKYRIQLSLNKNKYLNKKSWIQEEKQSFIKKIMIEEVYIPNFTTFSLEELIKEKPH